MSERKDGTFRPVAHPGAVVLSGGGAGDEADPVVVAQVTDAVSGVTSELSWPGVLPEPTVVGPRAVYADVEPGTDMVVDVTSTGVEQFFVLHEAPADPASITLPTVVQAEGAVASEPETAAVEFSTKDDGVVASVAAPLMWDQVADSQRANPVTEEFNVAGEPDLWAVDVPDEPTAAAAPAGKAATGAAEAGEPDAGVTAEVPVQVEVDGDQAALTLSPGAEFLEDPDVTYPVVIDPSIGLTISHDTYVQTDATVSMSTSPELRVGTYNGSVRARSFLHVISNPIKGKKVTSAYLKLYQFHSYSCTHRQFQVWSTGSSSTSTVWSTQPSWVNQWAATTDTKGYSSSCAADWTTINITDLAQAWADNAANYQAIGLKATDETDPYGWKRFRSSDASSGKPTVTINYNSYPSTPSTTRHTSEYSWWPSSSDANKVLYVKTLNPKFSATISDPDGGNARGQWDLLSGSTLVWDKVPGYLVASGGTSNVGASGAALDPGKSYTGRVWSYDGSLRSKSSTAITPFTVDVTAPATPTISASGYASNEWKAAKPSANKFTFTSTSTDAVKFEVTYDGKKTTLNPGTRTTTWDWNPGAGSHTVTVKAIDKAGWPSAARTFSFGNGGVALSGPANGLKSTDTFTSAASGPAPSSGTATATTYYRLAGQSFGSDSTTNGSTAAASGWTPVPGSAKTFTGSYKHAWSGAAIAAEKGLERRPMTLEVQVCVAYSSPALTRCTWNGSDDALKPALVRVPHAFGDAYPTSEAGPGQVALWTGEFNTSETDVSVPGYVGDLSISRSYSTLAAPDNDSVFGPGWDASFDGTDIGVAGWDVYDSTGVDGTIALVDDEGEPLLYKHSAGGRTVRRAGTYVALDAETAEYGAKLVIAASQTSMTFTEDDGTATTFDYNATAGEWLAVSVKEPASSKTTTLTRDPATGRVTRILAPAPDGVQCAGTGTPLKGCRALDITYGTSGSAKGKVVEVVYQAWDPDKPGGAGMAGPQVATYAYDSDGRLAKVTDPRSGLSTSYTYSATAYSLSGQPLLTTVTPSGLAAYTLNYAGDTPVSVKGNLLSVDRAPATSGGQPVKVSRYVYDIDPSANVSGLPVMSTDLVSRWGQDTAPTHGYAVFSADKQDVGGGTNATITSPTQVSSGAWPFADLQYTDDDGRVLNTAAHGAGDWQFTSTGYDTDGRVIRSLDETATSQLREHNANGELAPEAIDSYATITRYNTAQGLNPAGTFVTDVWEPAVNIDDELVRTHTHTDYDQGAPNSGINPATEIPYRLPTTVTVMQADGLTGSADPDDPVATGATVLSQDLTGYDAIDGKPHTDPTSGWYQGQATTTTTVMGAGQTDIVTKTRYDGEGRTVEVRKPGSDGTDAATTLSGFYTAGPQTGVFADCGNKPEWAGLACATRSAEATPTTPVETTTKYSLYLAPREATETLGSVVRTTTTTYDQAGRELVARTTTSGLTGSESVPGTSTEYDPATGLATATVSLDAAGTGTGRISTGYDLWGQAVTYTDTDGETTTTAYDQAGRVTTVTDPIRTVEYGYGSDTEHRGYPTQVKIHGTGQFTATYDAAGNMTTQSLLGQRVTQHSTYDPRSGQFTGLDYTGAPLPGGAEVNWLSWTITPDIQGRTTSITSVASQSAEEVDEDGNPITGGGINRTQAFTYDRAERLNQATDTIGETCTNRTYGFDVRGNRLTKNSSVHDIDCTTTAVNTTVKTWTYDTADRVQAGANATGAYVYDALGRQTTMPSMDTPAGSTAGDLAIGYYDTDAARTLTQNGATTTYTLDPAGRRATAISSKAETDTITTVRHYTDTSDNPGYATKTTGAGAPVTTWYGASIGGDLGLEITGDTKTLTLIDPLGSTASTITLPALDQKLELGALGIWDEFGNTTSAPAQSGALGYGWLGGKERAQDSTGVTLMGARLYNATTGIFASVDPIEGGNTTDYAYPQDPINQQDLDGQFKRGARFPCRCGSNYFIRGVGMGGGSASLRGAKFPGPTKMYSSGRYFKVGNFSRTYGKNVSSIKSQANKYAASMRSRGFKASVGNVRHGTYGMRKDVTVVVRGRKSDNHIHTRHFITTKNYPY
ncbi:DNRLRE domain-containing protein [Cellulosimicrobium terreum]|nr:DNRLRE domain-containing protein [Cellulosimicrobium terreum]